MDWAKTIAKPDKKHFGLGVAYIRDLTVHPTLFCVIWNNSDQNVQGQAITRHEIDYVTNLFRLSDTYQWIKPSLVI